MASVGLDRPSPWLIAAALLLCVGGSAPAPAQCRLCSASPNGSRDGDAITSHEAGERPLSLTITTDLDFSRVVADGPGAVTLDPRGGSARATGRAQSLGGLAFTGRGHVEGQPGRSIRIDMPVEVVLESATGGRARVTGLVTDLPPAPRLGPDGRLDFAFGGRLELTGAADGDYRGRVAIEVSYE